MLEGIYTALITPMKNGSIDKGALIRIVDRQLSAGVHGLVLCATTGEGVILNKEEIKTVIQTVVHEVKNKTQIIVGTGQVATWTTIEATRMAADLGADAALVVTPSYLRPSQEGIIKHFEAVADEGGLPVILYNVPSRTASDILPDTVAHLANHEKIVGIKEASGSILKAQQVIAAASGKISVLSGDDPLTISMLLAGGSGVISTGANVVPERWVSLWNSWTDGNVKGAAAIQAQLLGLHEALFMEANPGPVKAAAHLLGLIEPEIRLPLTWPKAKTLYRLVAELGRLGFSPQGVA